MAKFKFKMASLLNLKARMEEQKEQEFSKAMKKLAEEKEKLAKHYADKHDAVQKFKGAASAKINPADFGMLNNFIEFMKKQIIIQQGVIIKAEQFVEQKRLELIEATKERKMLEKLKERAFEEYLEEEKKQEQKINDEIVSYKYSEI